MVGATASGKTALSLDLAQRCGGEVVNTDAMQIYRGMDIGTAKLPIDQRRRIPHHLLDLLSVREPAAVAQFQQWARAAIDQIRGRGRTPILVGGSALYTRAILDRFEFPGTDPEVRGSLEAELARRGPVRLHARLNELDPHAAAGIRPDNGRRIVRALEVVALTGSFSATLPEQEYLDSRTVQVGLRVERAELHERIEQRVESMFADGLVDEVQRLLDEGLEQGRTASRAIGYREVAAHLRGELTLAQARERTVVATRQFARRQEQWNRRDPRIHWFSAHDPDPVERARAAIQALP